MLTGLYPHNHCEIKNDTNHPYDRELYLDILKKNGWNNYYYGKWHAGPDTALDHGCEGFSYPSYNNPYTKEEYLEYLKEFDLPVPEIKVEHNFMPRRDVEGQIIKQDQNWCNEHASGIMLTPKETHEAYFLAHLACKKLKELGNNPAPFTMRVDFWGPHQPYFPTKEFADMYDPASIERYPSFDEDVYHNNKPEIYATEGNKGISENGKIIYPNPLPWSVWQEVLSRAYAQITLMDDATSLILDALDRAGLKENTLVILTTDHGDGLACHGGHFDKRSYMPEEMIRIPFAINLPGTIQSGQVEKRFVSNLDIGSTILDAAGLSYKEDTDSLSLLQLATGNISAGKTWRDCFVTETYGHGEQHLGRAIMTEDNMKFVYNYKQLHELYDLSKDPYELKNLYGLPGSEAQTEKMLEKLVSWAEKHGDSELLEKIKE